MKILVSMDRYGAVGELDVFENRGAEHYRFTYHPDWVIKYGFQLDPELPLLADMPFHSTRLWGVFLDASPDRWGRLIQERAHKRYLTAVEYLLGVSDLLRMGALRFALAEEPAKHLAEHVDVPKLVCLKELEEASRHVESGIETKEELAALIGAGSSMGGANPKASVQDGEQLYLAKFQPQRAARRTSLWEATLLDLAALSGQLVPKHRLLNKEGDAPILLVERFDRPQDGGRLPYVSALTMLEGADASYAELASVLSNGSAAPQEDSLELWRRMVFNAMAGNIDDHLRNHGFLRTPQGWRLSPVFDLNPVPFAFETRTHALAFMQGETNPSLKLLEETALFFNLGHEDKMLALRSVANALGQWREVAARNGLNSREIKNLENAFEHQGREELRAAISGSSAF